MLGYYFMYFFDMMEVVENGVWVSDIRRPAKDLVVWRRVIFFNLFYYYNRKFGRVYYLTKL